MANGIIAEIRRAEKQKKSDLSFEEFLEIWGRCTQLGNMIFLTEVKNDKPILKTPYIKKYSNYLVKMGLLKESEIGTGIPDFDIDDFEILDFETDDFDIDDFDIDDFD